jgi:hypothetical protein
VTSHVGDSHERLGDLSVGRVGEHRLAHNLDNWIADTWSSHSRDRLADPGLSWVHADWNAGALEEVADHAAVPVVGTADHLHRLDGRRRSPRPIAEVLGDCTVKFLVADPVGLVRKVSAMPNPAARNIACI